MKIIQKFVCVQVLKKTQEDTAPKIRTNNYAIFVGALIVVGCFRFEGMKVDRYNKLLSFTVIISFLFIFVSILLIYSEKENAPDDVMCLLFSSINSHNTMVRGLHTPGYLCTFLFFFSF